MSSWPTFRCGKKVKRPWMFKLMQQHTNNRDVGKMFIPSSGLPPIDVQPLGYGWIYNIFCGHKCFDVTIGNYSCCFCIYFIIMSITSLGGCGAWVQCKHLYHILQTIMYCGQSEKFMHYPTWNWDKVQWLLACAKALAHDIIIKLYLH